MENPSLMPCAKIEAENVALRQKVSQLEHEVEGLQRAHQQAARELAEYTRCTEALRQSHIGLERRLQERTMLWFEVNRALHAEIAQRKNTEAALRENQARYRAVVEDQTELICRCLPDGTLTFVNTACEHFWGKQRSALLGTRLQTLVPPDIVAVIEARIATLTVEEPVANTEHAMTCAAGIAYWYHWIDHAFFDEQGRMVEFQSVGRDITVYKHMKELLEQRVYERTRQIEENQALLQELNEQLHSNQSLLLAVFNGIEDGLMVVGNNGQIQLVNEPMALLLGVSPFDLVDYEWAILQPDLAPGFPASIQLQESSSHDVQRINYCRRDGIMRVLDLRSLALRSHHDHNAVERVVLHVVDVTEQVQLHTRLVENERMAASGRLAASVAHEINTPLQAIQTAFDLVRRSSSAEDRDMFLDHALEEIQRVAGIVRHLLTLYRPTAHTYRAVDVNALVERVVLLLGNRIKDQGVKLSCNFSPNLPTLNGRTDELIQVVLNLMINALEAMSRGGKLSVHTCLLEEDWHEEQQENEADREVPLPDGHESNEATTRSFLVIAISDTGVGVPPDLLENIFEPFVTTREEGTGLGLAISSEIIKKYEGRITVESEQGKGSTFRVMLPLPGLCENCSPHPQTPTPQRGGG